jgi:hypothetical protein
MYIQYTSEEYFHQYYQDDDKTDFRIDKDNYFVQNIQCDYGDDINMLTNPTETTIEDADEWKVDYDDEEDEDDKQEVVEEKVEEKVAFSVFLGTEEMLQDFRDYAEKVKNMQSVQELRDYEEEMKRQNKWWLQDEKDEEEHEEDKEEVVEKQVEEKVSNTKNTKKNRKVIAARYGDEAIYKLPNNLDVEDKSVVDSYWIKYGTLYISYTSKENLERYTNQPEDEDDLITQQVAEGFAENQWIQEIEAHYDCDEVHKFPIEVEIDDAEEYSVEYNQDE